MKKLYALLLAAGAATAMSASALDFNEVTLNREIKSNEKIERAVANMQAGKFDMQKFELKANQEKLVHKAPAKIGALDGFEGDYTEYDIAEVADITRNYPISYNVEYTYVPASGDEDAYYSIANFLGVYAYPFKAYPSEADGSLVVPFGNIAELPNYPGYYVAVAGYDQANKSFLLEGEATFQYEKSEHADDPGLFYCEEWFGYVLASSAGEIAGIVDFSTNAILFKHNTTVTFSVGTADSNSQFTENAYTALYEDEKGVGHIQISSIFGDEGNVVEGYVNFETGVVRLFGPVFEYLNEAGDAVDYTMIGANKAEETNQFLFPMVGNAINDATGIEFADYKYIDPFEVVGFNTYGNLVINFIQDSGAQDVVAPNPEKAPVRYFNLQGMQIKNPAPGQVVIMQQGNNVKKFIR